MNGQILKLLRESDSYLSGELLAHQLGISRVSIWKHIHSLKENGYVVEASPKGYRLISSPDLLLPCEFIGWGKRIHHFGELHSTMDEARGLARRGADTGTIVIAECQIKGRGRLNREWLSPEGGIYFSVILRPKISPVYAPRINLMASIAVATAIRKLFGLKAELKWPNDVLIGGKKVCGILAEMYAELDAIDFVNLGIGMNVNSSVSLFEKRATSLKDELGRKVSRKELLSAVLAEIEEQQISLMESDLLERWKKLSYTLDRQVRVESPDEVIEGQAVDIDTTGALIVKSQDGFLGTVFAGDCIQKG